MDRLLFKVLAGLCAALAATDSARADYTLTPSVGGQNYVNVFEGDTVSIDLTLARNNSTDFNTSAIFTVHFSKPGLQYTSYNWASPYTTGGVDDRSTPSLLPTTISTGSYVAPSNDPGDLELYFENFTGGGTYTVGSVVTLNIKVPVGFGDQLVLVTAVPDTFDDGNNSIAAIGGSMTLSVQSPEPGGLCLALTSLMIGLRRVRRSRRKKRRRGGRFLMDLF